jgi:hypothetical protein
MVATILVSIIISLKLMRPTPDINYFEWARGQLKETSALFLLYHSDTGVWPEEEIWENQIKTHFPKLNEQLTYNSKNGLFVDLWGSEIRYKVYVKGAERKQIIYSLGPNRKDEEGKGDDIVQIIK